MCGSSETVENASAATEVGGNEPKIDLHTIEQGLFFVVGVPRSGTTLVRAILSSHPRIVVPPETKFFIRFEPPTDERAWPRYWRRFFGAETWMDQTLDPDRFRARVEATDRSARSVFLTLMAMHSERLGKPRVGEKTPHHSKYVERLHELFPAARFIHVYRDPRDTVASQIDMPWGKRSHLSRARNWCRIMRRAERLEATLGADFYTMLRYEDLVERPDHEVRRICEFLGERYDETMVHFERRGDPGFVEQGEWKTRTLQPISRSSLGRYRKQLSPRQITGIERIAGSQMARYGYERDGARGRYPIRWRIADAMDRLMDAVRQVRRSATSRVTGSGQA